MKVISMYLPQFHRVKENDEWWGEGFTEWVALKNAKQLFEGHDQPQVPLDRNYYNLLDKETMKWQADLMHKYGVDGQCFYHYWFKDGRKILEKPAENLLKWTDINMPFCFCWANQSWARTWANVKDCTAWAPELEPKRDAEDMGVLLEQQYGNEEQWKEHFHYLLPFFLDERYIKKDNKPVIMLYKAAEMSCLDEMMSVWRKMAKEEGLSGIYLIGEECCSNESIDLEVVLEPGTAMGRLSSYNKANQGVAKYEYTEIWKEILEHPKNEHSMTIQGFVGRDDTPRNGLSGNVVINQNCEDFQQYLSELMAKNEVNGSDFTFINAWNEWGEGMHLEPDQKFGYGFLEGVLYAKVNYQKYISKYSNPVLEIENCKKELNQLKALNDKYRRLWRALDRLLLIKEYNCSVGEILKRRGICSVAIYGMGMLGRHLYEELKCDAIEVRFGIDRRTSENSVTIPLYRPTQQYPKVDLIVITAIDAYDEIAVQLRAKNIDYFISLEEVLMDWANEYLETKSN